MDLVKVREVKKPRMSSGFMAWVISGAWWDHISYNA